jgi:CBS domain-containing protein
MSGDLVTGTPHDSVQDAMGVMTNRRLRHLPIVNDDGRLVGIVSIGDLVKHQHDQLSMENHYLKSYIHG